jgi:hypothetical protein
MFGAPKRLPAFGALTFSTVITTSVVQDLNKKIAGVDCMMFRLSISLHVSQQRLLTHHAGAKCSAENTSYKQYTEQKRTSTDAYSSHPKSREAIPLSLSEGLKTAQINRPIV